MTFKNVEVIEQQEVHKKTLFQKFKSKLPLSVVATGVLVASNANAAEGSAIPDFLKPATDALSGIGVSLGALFVIAIGITLVIIAFTNSRGGIRKAG
ncbi:hypothetical protein ACG9X6_23610 [Acinetobacter guillouiae]|uniref:hypothetical protein n=1 Tax=Acinetobacter guillouiae TaxID=106649 RepID=UPI003AF4B1CA